MNAFTSAYAGSDLFGKGIFLALFALSIITWALLIIKTLQLRSIKKFSKDFSSLFVAHKGSLLTLELSHDLICSPFGKLLSRIKDKTMETIEKNHYFSKQKNSETPLFLSQNDMTSVESSLLTELGIELKSMEKNLFILTTIVTLAPFLGLLGTVWGILQTFGGLQSGPASASNSAVLSGLATALTTTVLGLLIAIPALVGYNYLKALIADLANEMEVFGFGILEAVELQYRRADLPE